MTKPIGKNITSSFICARLKSCLIRIRLSGILGLYTHLIIYFLPNCQRRRRLEEVKTQGEEDWIRRLVEKKFGASNYPIGKYNTSSFLSARLESCFTRIHVSGM